MARIRTIKPQFWSHPITGKLDDASKCMAIALLNLADDEGYFYADPATVRSFCRPFDDDSKITLRCLQDLSCKGYIKLSEHPIRGSVGHIVGFLEHQRVDKPTQSNIKGYFLQEQSKSIPRTFPVGREGKGREEEGIGGSDLSAIVNEIGHDHPSNEHLSGKSLPYAQEQIICEAIMRDGADLVRAGTRNYRDAVAGWDVTERRFIVNPVRFYGEEAHYLKNPVEWQRNGKQGNASSREEAVRAALRGTDDADFEQLGTDTGTSKSLPRRTEADIPGSRSREV